MSYRLRQGLSACICEGRPIFLDIDTRRYSTLPARLWSPFAALMAGNGTVPRDDVDRLLALRVIEHGRPLQAPLEIVPSPDHETIPVKPRGWSISAIVAQGLAARQLRNINFRRLLIEEAARHPAKRKDADERGLGRLRGAFDRIATLYGEVDQCLPRSLAFRRLALRYGYATSLVIGVKIDPFGAHCWVQTGSRVENDSLERVRLFTPILAI